MFTGIIEEVGSIVKCSIQGESRHLRIEAVKIAEDVKPEDSISVNGACLTVSSCDPSGFEADVVPETVKRTTLGTCRTGERVNLERAVRFGDRLGGHWVQGHVDGIGRILSVKSAGTGRLCSIRIPQHLMGYIVEKGSIALNGVSLTIASVERDIVTVALIPVTLSSTIFGVLQSGDEINIETDILAKYVEKQLKLGIARPSSESGLRAMGYEI